MDIQARLGNALSVLDFANFGSSLSVRGYARLGSSLSINNALHFGKENTYITHDQATFLDDQGVPQQYESLQFYADSGTRAFRGLTVHGEGGRLHGTWVNDNPLTSSDRRLKSSIAPLYRAFKDAGPKTDDTKERDASEGVSWVLRQLRPVSYKFKSGPEAKYSRYGFVAQELQQVLPAVVRGQGDQHLSVAYQDLIALLTLAQQITQDKVTKAEVMMQKQEDQIAALSKQLQMLTEKMDLVLESRIDAAVEKRMAALDRATQVNATSNYTMV